MRNYVFERMTDEQFDALNEATETMDVSNDGLISWEELDAFLPAFTAEMISERERDIKKAQEIRDAKYNVPGLKYDIVSPEEVGGNELIAKARTHHNKITAYNKYKREIDKAKAAESTQQVKQDVPQGKYKTKSQKKKEKRKERNANENLKKYVTYSKPFARYTKQSTAKMMLSIAGRMLLSAGRRPRSNASSSNKLRVGLDEEELERMEALGIHM